VTCVLYGNQWEKHGTINRLYNIKLITCHWVCQNAPHHCLMKQTAKFLALPLYILHVLSLNLEQETGGPVEGFCCLPKSL